LDSEILQQELEDKVKKLQAEVKRLKHRVIKKGKVAVNEDALKKVFGLLYARKVHQVDRRHLGVYFNQLFDDDSKRSNKGLLGWLNE